MKCHQVHPEERGPRRPVRARRHLRNSRGRTPRLRPARIRPRSSSARKTSRTASPTASRAASSPRAKPRTSKTRKRASTRKRANMRASDNGHANPGRPQPSSTTSRITMSNQIYADKHNADDRALRKQRSGPAAARTSRIASPTACATARSTPGQTAKLEGKEQGINHEVAGMRQANGGKLTSADKKTVKPPAEQSFSKQIYNKKHEANSDEV